MSKARVAVLHVVSGQLTVTAGTTLTVLITPRYQLIASHTIDPYRNYWPNQEKSSADGRGHLFLMTRHRCNP
jgi:hypothetical protein